MPKSSEDSAIESAIALVRTGEHTAYAEIVRLTEVKVRVVLAAIMPSPESIDDVAQEVYLTAFRKLDDYQAGTDFVLWLKAITRNIALNERRRWFKENALRNDMEDSIEERIADQEETLFERLNDSLTVHLTECVEKLQEPFRSLVRDFYYKEVPSKEIASKLGKSDTAVRLMLWRSRNGLAECMKKKNAI